MRNRGTGLGSGWLVLTVNADLPEHKRQVNLITLRYNNGLLDLRSRIVVGTAILIGINHTDSIGVEENGAATDRADR